MKKAYQIAFVCTLLFLSHAHAGPRKTVLNLSEKMDQALSIIGLIIVQDRSIAQDQKIIEDTLEELFERAVEVKKESKIQNSHENLLVEMVLKKLNSKEELDLYKVSKLKLKELGQEAQLENFNDQFDRYINKEYFEMILKEVSEVCGEETEDFQNSFCNGYFEGIFDKKTLVATETLSYIINQLSKNVDENFEDISIGVKNFLGLERTLTLYIFKGNKLEKFFNKRRIKASKFKYFLIDQLFYQSK